MITIDLTNEARVAIKCKRGDTFNLSLLKFWSDQARTIPINISTDIFAMQVKNAKKEIVLTFVSPTNFIITNTNELTITASETQMDVLASPLNQPYLYDCERTTIAGVTSTIFGGPFIIENDITNNA